jgi:hypothetical protein
LKRAKPYCRGYPVATFFPVIDARGRKVTIYLPIAELSVNIFVILGMGAAVGFLSGMFGVGGGFLITPLLIFYNIPPAVAVATGANQVVASSVSGALWRISAAARLISSSDLCCWSAVLPAPRSAYRSSPCCVDWASSI